MEKPEDSHNTERYEISLVDIKLNLKKKIGSLPLNVNVDIAHSNLAIFGPTGSGKTTFLNCIAGFQRPDSGHIEFNSDIFFSSSQSINLTPDARRLGFVFQDANLFPHLNVLRNVEYGYKLTPTSERRFHPDELLGMFELEHLADRSTINLSGGERQRVALARALAASPKLLLLDEPFASMDVISRGVLIGQLRLISERFEIPMIYVTHSIAEVAAVADYVLVLQDGRLVAEGPPSMMWRDADVGSLTDLNFFENIMEGTLIEGTDDDWSSIDLGASILRVPTIDKPLGTKVTLSIKASDIILSNKEIPSLSEPSNVRGGVAGTYKHENRLMVELDVGQTVVSEVTVGALKTLDLSTGAPVYLIVKTGNIGILSR